MAARSACSDGHIGYNAGSSGLVTVNGTGSTWTNGSSLYVGDYGTGNLSITNGGSVTNSSFYSVNFIGYNSGSSGTVTVDGAGSTWTTAGGHGNASTSVTPAPETSRSPMAVAL